MHVRDGEGGAARGHPAGDAGTCWDLDARDLNLACAVGCDEAELVAVRCEDGHRAGAARDTEATPWTAARSRVPSSAGRSGTLVAMAAQVRPGA